MTANELPETQMNNSGEDNAEAAQYVSLSFQIPGCEMQILADHAATFEALGRDWLERVITAVQLAYPHHQVELRTLLEDAEPMANFNDVRGFVPPEANTTSTITIAPILSPVAAPLVRCLNLPAASLLESGYDFTFIKRTSLLHTAVSKAYEFAYEHTPILLDDYRQIRNRMPRETPIVEVGGLPSAAVAGGEKPDFSGLSPQLLSRFGLSDAPDSRPTVWVAMHWLENGGAEAWALDQVRIAHEQGWRVIVTVDRCSPQRLLTQVEQYADVVLLVAHALGQADWGQMAAAIIDTYQVQVLHIHHAVTAYMLLPQLRERYPQLRLVDSTHIREHRGGGFPQYSVINAEYLDIHHVISPQLVQMLAAAGVPAEKIAYAPLTHFTDAAADPNVHKPLPRRKAGQRLRVGFLGRLAIQKRPFLFVEMVRRLHQQYPDDFHFIMQGEGELAAALDRQIERSGLTNVIERRAWGPTASFFADIDVLVICSENEGLTLTALEADVSDTLVLSANVGSQATITVPELLVPAMPQKFLRAAQLILPTLARRPDVAVTLLEKQRELIAELRTVENAAEFAQSLYQKDPA